MVYLQLQFTVNLFTLYRIRKKVIEKKEERLMCDRTCRQHIFEQEHASIFDNNICHIFNRSREVQ